MLLLTPVLLLVAVGATVPLVRRPDPGQPTGPSGASASPGPGPGRVDARSAAAAPLLQRLASRLERGSRGQVVALAAPDGRRELATLRHNVRVLRMTGLSLRYVPSVRRRLPLRHSWVGTVRVRWRLPGTDPAASRTSVPMTFRQVAGSTRFVTARAASDAAVPLWLLDRVSVARTPRSVVIAVAAPGDGSTARFSRLADRAVADVRTVLRRWRGRVVVEVPRDQHQLTRVLGARRGAYSAIAAVTTTADDSLSRRAPVHVFVNRRVFDPLGDRGSQIVLSHEATHVAMGAALSPMPVWLLEGFADYVAFAHVDLPVSRTASQVIARVRRSGVPDHLPGQVEFAPDNPGLGASYESAWLACRLIAQRYGERRLVAFYRASDRASATGAAFRQVLGTDQRTFTRAWRDDLRRLAGTARG